MYEERATQQEKRLGEHTMKQQIYKTINLSKAHIKSLNKLNPGKVFVVICDDSIPIQDYANLERWFK